MNKRLLTVVILSGAILAGCTQAILKVAGVDPDEVNLTPAEQHSSNSYVGTIGKIKKLRQHIKDHGSIIIPTKGRVEEYLDKSGYLDRATKAYRDAVYDAIGSKRSISEIRKIVVPAAIHNTYMDVSFGLVEALKKRGLFKTLEVIETAEYPTSLFKREGTTIIADYSSNQGLLLRVISDGYRSSAAGSEVFKGRGTGANLKFTRFLGWVENTIKKSAIAAANENEETISTSTPERVNVETKKQTNSDIANLAFPSLPVNIQFKQQEVRPNDIAVIIGNANYQRGKDIPNVTPAYADAAGMKNYITQALGIREDNIIFLKDASQAELIATFGSEANPKGQLFNYVKAGASRVFVYYSGHGAPGGEDGASYLVPSDAQASLIELNGYSLKTLYNNLGKLPAKSVTVVLEACFSGASQAGSVIPKASSIYLKGRQTGVPPNITVIAAGAANQIASWEQDLSSGLFTKYFLKGMSGEADASPYGNADGKVSYDELGRYFKDTLTYFARRYYGRQQTPQIVVGSMN